MTDNTPSPPISPDASFYDDEKVLKRIQSMQHSVCQTCDLGRIRQGLADVYQFTQTYYDDRQSQDSAYYAALLTPALVHRLLELYFQPLFYEQVTRVIDAVIPENWERVVTPDFVAQLSYLIAHRPDGDSDRFLCSVTLLTRRLVGHGSEALKTVFVKRNLIRHMQQFVAEVLPLVSGPEWEASAMREALIHVLWASGELIPVAEQVNPAEAVHLYGILKQFLLHPEETVVKEAVWVMDQLCISPEAAGYLPRHETIACLLWVMRRRPEWHSPPNHIFRRALEIVRTVLTADSHCCIAVLEDIRRDWGIDNFFSFLIKEHRSRSVAEVGIAIDMLPFVAAQHVMQVDLVPHVIDFMFQSVQEQQEEGFSSHPSDSLFSALRFFRNFVSAKTASQAVFRAVDAGLLVVVHMSLHYFKRNSEIANICLQIISNLLVYPEPQVSIKVAAALVAAKPFMDLIEELSGLAVNRELSGKILDDCEELITTTQEPAKDILLLMDRMRLG